MIDNMGVQEITGQMTSIWLKQRLEPPGGRQALLGCSYEVIAIRLLKTISWKAASESSEVSISNIV